MAAAKRIMHIKRLLSLTNPLRGPTLAILNKEPSPQFFHSSSIFTRQDFCRRAFQTKSNPENINKGTEDDESGSLTHQELASTPALANNNNESALRHSVISNLKTSSRHDLAMVFTCKVCETRSIKTLCRQSYEKGVVLARCSGCNNVHLLADRLGWFGEPGSIEDFLAARGEEVKKGSVDTLNLTLEDLAGKEVLKE